MTAFLQSLVNTSHSLTVLSSSWPPAPGARALPAAALPCRSTLPRVRYHGPAQPCSGSFVAHDLDFVAMQPGGEAHMFNANGAGAAIGDLDADGQLDIVLANQRGPATILWNAGGLRFRAERLPQRDTR